MQIKTFQAKDMAEALRMVKAEFGPDAMILTSNKMRKKGLLGYFEKPVIEVTALLDNRPRKHEYEHEPVKEVVSETNTMEEFQKSMLAPLAREIKELRTRVEIMSRTEKEREQAATNGSAVQGNVLKEGEERSNVEELKRYLLRAADSGQERGVASKQEAGVSPSQRSISASEVRPDLEDLRRILSNSLAERKGAANGEVKAERISKVPQQNIGADPRLQAEELRRLLLRLGEMESGHESVKSVAQNTHPLSHVAGRVTSYSDDEMIPAVADNVLQEGGQDAVATDAFQQQVSNSASTRLSEADELKLTFSHVVPVPGIDDRQSEKEEFQPSGIPTDEQKFLVLKQLLQANGVDDDEVDALLSSIDITEIRDEDDAVLRERLRECISAQVVCSKQITLNNSSPLIMAFVGPTGVGKTTTVAKLAALTAKQRERLAIITIDTYRIGAVEQLKTYADIMGIPFTVAGTPAELLSAIEVHADKQLILIDTSGISPRNQGRLLEIKSFLDVVPGIETHLCLAAPTRDKEQLLNFEKFSILPLSKVLFTKLDESESFGCILNMHLKNKIPLSFFTSGQKVQDDVKLATPKKVAEMVLGEMKP